MKKNLMISLVLTVICLVCAFGIGYFNTITSPIIAENTAKTEAKLCSKIFSEYDSLKSTTYTEFENSSILKKVEARDASSNELGYIYTVSGKNDYGTITLLVGIDNNKELVSVEFLENGQSFSKIVKEYVKTNYVGGLTQAQVTTLDTSCGATYGAKLTKNLVNIAFNDLNGGTN